MIENIFDIKGKVALVTGGARGIGAMIAQGFVEAGVKVYISSRNGDACAAFANKMNEIGECVALPYDLLQIENIESLVASIAEQETKLDILVNNSGVSWGAPLDEFPEKGWDKVMDLNVKSLFFLSQKMLPLLRAAGTKDNPARIINISSIAARMATGGLSAFSYNASKAAVDQLTRNLASVLVREHILVNAIAPGFFPSKMTSFMEEETMAKMIPMGRIGRPADIAGLAIFLSSTASNFMTGNSIVLDGGTIIQN